MGGIRFPPYKKLRVRSDFNEFYLATVEDGLYNSSGVSLVLNRKATSGHIGSETNTVALYQYSKVWKFGAGLGHLFAGEYLKESKDSFGYTYPYVMLLGIFISWCVAHGGEDGTRFAPLLPQSISPPRRCSLGSPTTFHIEYWEWPDYRCTSGASSSHKTCES